MGKVIALIKIMPDGVKSDDELRALMQSVKDTIKPPVELTRMDAKDIAFGLRAVTATIILEDGVGGPEPVCDALAKIPGVESVEVTDMGRI